MAQEYIPKVSEKVQGRVTKKLSKEFSRTESRILSALCQLDKFFLNPQVRACSIAVPGNSTNNNSENRASTENRSLNDPCLEVVFSASHTSNLNDSEQEQTHDMMTAVQEGSILLPWNSSAKQLRTRSTNQPQLRIENTLATIEAYQVLLALTQLAANSTSTNFNNNINTISKLPESLTKTILTLNGKSEKFELFEDLFQTSLKVHKQVTGEDKINYLHSLMGGDAPQIIKNITSLNGEKL